MRPLLPAGRADGQVLRLLPLALRDRFWEAANTAITADLSGVVACIFLFLGAFSFYVPHHVPDGQYAAEVLPSRMRASGIVLRVVEIKAYGVLVTVVVPYLTDTISWRAYVAHASLNGSI